MRRPLLISVGFALAAVSGAQQRSAGPSLFATTKPEATVVVRKHSTGADLVEVTVLRADYPEAELRAKAERVGVLTGTPVRGLNVTGGGGGGFVKASFATDGLISAEKPRLRLEPILRAFGYGGTPLKALAIIYDGQRADATTVRTYNPSPAFRLEGQALPNGIEYRSVLGDIPEEDVTIREDRPAVQAVVPEPKRGDLTLPILFGVGALAAGVLVYSLLLRPRPSRGR